MALPRQKRLKVLAQLLIRLRQRKQLVRKKARGKLSLPLAVKQPTSHENQPVEIEQEKRPKVSPVP